MPFTLPPVYISSTILTLILNFLYCSTQSMFCLDPGIHFSAYTEVLRTTWFPSLPIQPIMNSVNCPTTCLHPATSTPAILHCVLLSSRPTDEFCSSSITGTFSSLSHILTYLTQNCLFFPLQLKTKQKKLLTMFSGLRVLQFLTTFTPLNTSHCVP